MLGPIQTQSQTSLDSLTGTGQCGHQAAQVPQNQVGPPEQGRCGLGPRLPFLVISPYAKSDYVDSTVIDQSSVVKFIEYNWGLPMLGNGAADAAAGSILSMFHFGSAANRGLFINPVPASQSPVAGPSVTASRPTGSWTFPRASLNIPEVFTAPFSARRLVRPAVPLGSGRDGRPPVGQRRLGMRLSRRARVITAVVAVAALSSVGATTALASQRSPAGHHHGSGAATATPIKHLVVIFDENVSFDHYFGTYPYAPNPGEPAFRARPGTPTVNGLYSDIATPARRAAAEPQSQRVQPGPAGPQRPADL